MARLDLGPRLHEIKAPTLVVVAGADTVCGRDGYEALRCALEVRRFLVGE